MQSPHEALDVQFVTRSEGQPDLNGLDQTRPIVRRNNLTVALVFVAELERSIMVFDTRSSFRGLPE